VEFIDSREFKSKLNDILLFSFKKCIETFHWCKINVSSWWKICLLWMAYKGTNYILFIII